MGRVNAFEGLDEFTTKAEPKPVEKAQIDRLSEENGFPSRQPVKDLLVEPVPAAPLKMARRRTTGRNQQINIKAKGETIERLYRLADRDDLPLGELLDKALDAYDKQS
jgi:hypothetical protein